MGKTYVRIDDRLIHGQIVLAWSVTLGINEIIAVDDTLAANPMLQTIMTMGVPAQYHPCIVTTAKAQEILGRESSGNRLVITRFCRNLGGIAAEIKTCEHINLGNCSKQDNSKYSLNSGAGRFLSLTQEDMDTLLALEKEGCKIFSQLLPSDKINTWESMKNSAGV